MEKRPSLAAACLCIRHGSKAIQAKFRRGRTIREDRLTPLFAKDSLQPVDIVYFVIKSLLDGTRGTSADLYKLHGDSTDVTNDDEPTSASGRDGV